MRADRLLVEQGHFDSRARAQAAAEPRIGAVVLTGAEGFFCAGGDLNLLMTAGPDDIEAISAGLDHYKETFRRLETLGRPVVAAINGTALGGGFEVALAAVLPLT